MVKQALGWLAGLAVVAGILGLYLLVGDRYLPAPDNAQIILDFRNHVFASPPCVTARATERPLELADDVDLSVMGEVHVRRQAGEKWRPDEKCNAVNGFTQTETIRARLFGQESRWTADGRWRW